ncbi:MAG: UDP-N-acetylmuramoyl-tripeptide--D-alanyl-D-alanine ligase [Candidatus Muiribacteriota bacterium]
MKINIDILMEMETILKLDGCVFEDYGGVEFDTRRKVKDKIFLCFKGNNTDGHLYIKDALKQGALAVVSEDFEKIKNFSEEITIIHVKSVLKFLAELSRIIIEKNNIKIVALTGSAGKTTTREILFNIFSKKFITSKSVKNFNNNLGVPYSIINSDEKTEFFIAECGMNHQGELTEISKMLSPDSVLLLNVGYVHSGNFDGIKDIAKAKMELTSYMKKNGRLIYNKKIEKYINIPEKFKTVSFGEDKNADFYYKVEVINNNKFKLNIFYNNKTYHFELMGLPLLAQNYVGAIATALQWDFEIDEIDLNETLKVNDRMEFLHFKGFDFMMDCYNSNPFSLEKILPQLSNISGKWIVILGDMKELGKDSIYWHQKVGEIFADNVEGKLVCFGELAVMFGEGALKAGRSIGDIYFVNNVEEVCRYIRFAGKKYKIFIKGSRAMKMEKIISCLRSME